MVGTFSASARAASIPTPVRVEPPNSKVEQAGSSRPPADESRSRRHFVILSLVVLGLVVGCALCGWEFLNPGLNPDEPKPPSKPSVLPGIELVSGALHTLTVSEAVQQTLGIQKNGKKQIAVASLPTHGHPLNLPGSTALDPSKITRVRARFAPAEVVQVMQVQQADSSGRQTIVREIRPGDRVARGDVLGVFYSSDVGNKKNDLIDALLSLDLHKGLLERAEATNGAVPEVFLMNARSLVLSDENAIRRAENTLRTWSISTEDIQAVHKEAAEIIKNQGKRDKTKESDWARVELKTPAAGVLVERNVSLHEVIVDGTASLFVLADIDPILVRADVHEDDLPALESLSLAQRKWVVRTVGSAPVPGVIDDIGYLIDPNQHTAAVKGHIGNSRGILRGGQFASVTVELPPPPDVVEIPIKSIVEDGKQCLIFVQPEADKTAYTMRRVLVTQRFDHSAFVRSRLTPEESRLTEAEMEEGSFLPPQPLNVGERVLTSGVLELKAALEDRESAASPQHPDLPHE